MCEFSKNKYHAWARQSGTEGTGKLLQCFIPESKLIWAKTNYGAKTQVDFGPEDEVEVEWLTDGTTEKVLGKDIIVCFADQHGRSLRKDKLTIANHHMWVNSTGDNPTVEPRAAAPVDTRAEKKKRKRRPTTGEIQKKKAKNYKLVLMAKAIKKVNAKWTPPSDESVCVHMTDKRFNVKEDGSSVFDGTFEVDFDDKKYGMCRVHLSNQFFIDDVSDNVIRLAMEEAKEKVRQKKIAEEYNRLVKRGN